MGKKYGPGTGFNLKEPIGDPVSGMVNWMNQTPFETTVTFIFSDTPCITSQTDLYVKENSSFKCKYRYRYRMIQILHSTLPIRVFQ